MYRISKHLNQTYRKNQTMVHPIKHNTHESDEHHTETLTHTKQTHRRKFRFVLFNQMEPGREPFSSKKTNPSTAPHPGSHKAINTNPNGPHQQQHVMIHRKHPPLRPLPCNPWGERKNLGGHPLQPKQACQISTGTGKETTPQRHKERKK